MVVFGLLLRRFKTRQFAHVGLPVTTLSKRQIDFAIVYAVEPKERKRCIGRVFNLQFKPLPCRSVVRRQAVQQIYLRAAHVRGLC